MAPAGDEELASPPGLAPGALGEHVLAMGTLSSYLSFMHFATQQVRCVRATEVNCVCYHSRQVL